MAHALQIEACASGERESPWRGSAGSVDARGIGAALRGIGQGDAERPTSSVERGVQQALWMSDNPCVLLAEDDVDLRELLVSRLSSLGYHVVPVADGLDAMRYLADTRHAVLPEPTPDLVISDLRLPRCDGIEVLAYARLWSVPTIIVTAFGAPDALCEADALGAVAWLSKPFDFDLLGAIVRQYATRAAQCA